MRLEDNSGSAIWESDVGTYIQVDSDGILIFPTGEGVLVQSSEHLKDLKEAVIYYESLTK